MSAANRFPALPYEEWNESKTTLHLLAQIVGKIRMTMTPKLNHWWHAPLYVCGRGLTTSAIPFEGGVFEMRFDLLDHQFRIDTSAGAQRTIRLGEGSVADFYHTLMQELKGCGIEPHILARPYDMPIDTPFAKDTARRPWDAEYITRFWRVLCGVEPIFEEFRGRFYGKSTPVHLFWHSFDLALTRFSGREAPPLENTTQANKEAYSHEVISFGFWAGDQNTLFPAFYSYAWPEPEGLAQKPLIPKSAQWVDNNGAHLAILKYEDVRAAADPRGALLSFLQNSYEAAARLADWDIESLKTPWA